MYRSRLGNRGIANLDAINTGFHLAFIGAVIVTAVGATISLIYIKGRMKNETRVKK